MVHANTQTLKLVREYEMRVIKIDIMYLLILYEGYLYADQDLFGVSP